MNLQEEQMAASGFRLPQRSVRTNRTRLKSRARSDKNVRTTLVLPEPLDKNVEAYCAKEGVSKNEAFLQLLSQALTADGYKPDKTPKVTISY